MSTIEPSAMGMWPIDTFAPRPAVPHSERIFAASRELHEAYAQGDEWTKDVPLHQAAVLLVMETVDGSIRNARRFRPSLRHPHRNRASRIGCLASRVHCLRAAMRS